MFLFGLFILIEKPKKKFVKKYFKSPYNGCSQPYYNHSWSVKTKAGYPIAKHVDIFNVDVASTQIILKTFEVVPIYCQS